MSHYNSSLFNWTISLWNVWISLSQFLFFMRLTPSCLMFVWTGEQHSAQCSLQAGLWKWPIGEPLRANCVEVGGEDRNTRKCIRTVQESCCVSGEKFSRCHSLKNKSGCLLPFPSLPSPFFPFLLPFPFPLFSQRPKRVEWVHIWDRRGEGDACHQH